MNPTCSFYAVDPWVTVLWVLTVSDDYGVGVGEREAKKTK